LYIKCKIDSHFLRTGLNASDQNMPCESILNCIRIIRGKSLSLIAFRRDLDNFTTKEISIFPKINLNTNYPQVMKSTVIVFNGNGMGHAPENLSKILVKNYLGLLTDENHHPAVLLFYGEGVKLVCEGSEVIDSLVMLERKGTKLISCKTCLKYFELDDKVKAGKVGTMADILTMQMEAGKVITV
jgi:hypothetical protein